MKKLLHTEAFTQKTFTQAFTQRNFYTQKLLHTETFTHRSFSHKKKPVHRGTFTQRNLYAQTRLHTVAFTHRSFLYREVFTHLSSCLIFHDHSPSVTFISSFSCSFGQLPPSFSFHFARCSVRPRFVLAPSAAKQTKREPRNK